MDALTATPLCPSPIELELDQVAFERQELLVSARARRRVVACPVCRHASKRVHSRYERTLLDLPWHGLRVRLALRVRRFFCDHPGCPRRIFTERLPKTAAPYARRTARAMSALEVIGLALGGRAGARLARALGIGGDPSAVRAALMHGPTRRERADESSTVRVIGIDDWAWKKGARYGTIVVDLEHQRVIDLLPDREPETVAAWLAEHPTIEFITRDRASAYADAAMRGAPQAIQIADRFHLFRNVTEAAQRAVERHHRRIGDITLETAADRPAATPEAPVAKRGGPVSRPAGERPLPEQRKLARRERRRASYEDVLTLHTGGASVAEIHRRVGLSRATITRWLRAGGFPERQPVRGRRTSLTPHAAYLTDRWQAGCHNATALWRELRTKHAFRGGVSTVRDWIRTHVRRSQPSDAREASGGQATTALQPLTRRPSVRRAGWLLTAPPDRLTEPEQHYVQAVCAVSPALARLHALALEFRRMFKAHDPNMLTPWLGEAERSELHSLGVSMRRDRDAVLAAIVFRWSNGQVEGQVNRLKLLKRMMYGRASFPLLRQRVLAA